MKALLILTGLAMLLTGTAAFAQSSPTQTTPMADSFGQDGIWNGTMTGGRYLVKANQIIALSKHEYVADGAARVVEVNLTLSSNTCVRFYFLEPVKLEGNGAVAVGQQAIDRARAMVQDAATRISPTLTELKVTKTYPVSTHAHTVEFVIKEEVRLNSLFDSLEAAFRDPGKRHVWHE